MRRAAMMVAALLAAVILGGCADKYESVVKEELGYLREMSEVLKNVQDEASMEKAKPRIEELAEKMRALSKKVEEMPEPSPERLKRLKAKYDKEAEKAMSELTANAARVAVLRGGADLAKLVKKVSRHR